MLFETKRLKLRRFTIEDAEAEYTNATSEIQTRNLPGDGGPVDPELEGYFFHLKMSCAKEYSEDGWIEFDEYFSNKQDCVCALNNYSQYVCSGDGAFSVQVDEKCTSKYTTVPSLSSCTP